jgi:osmotically-inducible protein OsmY
MKAIYAMRLAGGALIVAMSVGAWAQDQSSAPAASSGSMGMSAPSGHMKQDRKANRALEKKVRYAFTHTKGLDASMVTIKARTNGAVWLAGTVTDNDQVQKAGDVAGKVTGVTSVKNNVTVKQVGQ